MRQNLVVVYILLVGLPLLVALGMLDYGRSLAPGLPAHARALPAAGASGAAGSASPFTLVLQIAVILLAARTVGVLFRLIRQPQVVGEMAAGILLGPSLLGWVTPSLSHLLFPPASLANLSALSQVGLVLFMFQVGLAVNPKELRGHSRTTLLTSQVSIVFPFCLGTILAAFLYPRVAEGGVSFLNFALFLGSAMSITAFPVLARILMERHIMHSRLGTLAIACAAINDVTGWCILAGIVVLTRARQDAVPVWVTVAGAALYVVVMTFGLRRMTPWFEHAFRKSGRLSDNAVALMILLVLVSALITDLLGIHLLFGAFVMGAIMPKSEALVRHVLHRFESMTTVVLLPLFFAFSGLRTSLGALSGKMTWLYLLLIVGAAVAGKMGGTVVAARSAGVAWRDSAVLGILMNTRGLMELVVLNLGLDLGVISPTVFSMLVVMALVTTFMTSPLLDLVYRPEPAAAGLPAAVHPDGVLEGHS